MSGSWFPELRIYRVTPGGIHPHHTIPASADTASRVSLDGDYLAVNSVIDGPQAVDLRTRHARALTGARGGSVEFAFSPEGSMLAVAGRDAGYELWDYRAARRTRTRISSGAAGSSEASVREAFFSSRGKYLAVAAEPRSYVYEVASGRIAASFQTSTFDSCSSSSAGNIHGFALPRSAALQLSPDERYAANCNEGRLTVVDLATGRETPVSLAGVGSFQFAPPFLAVASAQRATILALEPLTPVARFPLGDTVSGFAFNPGEKQLITWGGSTIRRDRLWSGPAEEACLKVARNLTVEQWRAHIGDASYRKTCPDLR
jgi:WD40 repeat protein